VTPAPIVVGLALRDDDTAPLALGRVLADLTGAAIALVHAYHLDVAAADALPVADTRLRRDALELLERRAAPLRERHEVTVQTRAASPPTLLHRYAIERATGLLVVGSSHRGRVRRALSVTSRVLHDAPCAVAVAPRSYAGEARPRRIAVAYDGSPESEDALTAGIGVALLAGAALHVCTVVEPVDARPALVTPGWAAVMEEPESRRARATAFAEHASALVPEPVFGGADVLTGRAPDALSAFSEDFDMLLCGSRSYGAVRSLLLGSCTRSLLNHVACPMLILPRGPEARLGVLTARDPSAALL
jgi:nucleotide-binding universal stress UspA family protein